MTEQQATKVQHIWCSAIINKKMEDVLVSHICNSVGISEYVVYLSTFGGNPSNAVSLYNFIKSIPQTTTVYNMGYVYSAGVPFFLGFRKRIGVPNCSFLIHQTRSLRTELPEQFNVADIETQREILLSNDEQTQNIILNETVEKGKKSFNSEVIKSAFRNTATYTAEKAEEFGIIEKIELPKLPEAGVLYLTDQYLATLQG
jgi:ATP-dependent protease ClpP protease subunit